MTAPLTDTSAARPSAPATSLGLHVPTTRRDTAVLGQAIPVNAVWWQDRLAAVGWLAEAPFPALEVISRSDIFGLADDACSSPAGARRLLWAALSWGTGRRQRGNRRRISSVVTNDEAGKLLMSAAIASRRSATAGLEVLQPRRRPLLTGLGPSFSTKFLYFAGGGDPDHPCLILDAVVAARLRSRPWPDFAPRYQWDPPTYADYCRVLHDEAGRLSSAELRVTADQLEVDLFTGAQPA